MKLQPRLVVYQHVNIVSNHIIARKNALNLSDIPIIGKIGGNYLTVNKLDMYRENPQN